MCTERKATGEHVLACFMFATMNIHVMEVLNVTYVSNGFFLQSSVWSDHTLKWDQCRRKIKWLSEYHDIKIKYSLQVNKIRKVAFPLPPLIVYELTVYIYRSR